ncbi:MAG: antibiotic biosynthesis monooxygenase [Chloroflexi bacterium]|nr:antibiotic biosynthesis monooxygenase [Chloroflexota bacterium]MDL1941861.1 antibiotic biosynthesis monooxygenase [Chloroflexi bacterium CFX2]
MMGKLTALNGKRGMLAEVLLRASQVAAQMDGCRSYVIFEDLRDETCLWVFETWDSKDAHDASLQDERVRSLIAEAKPMIDGMPFGAELRLIGGHGISC